MDISGTQLRAVRAALFTALVVTLSTASHVLLSQVPLPLTTVAVIAGAVFVVAYALAGRERGFGRIAALLIPLELAADTLFTAGQHACYGKAGGPVAGPLRSVGFDVLCGGEVGTPLARVTGGETQPAAALLANADPAAAWLLLGAHIGVGLLAAAWLRRGERALAQLLDAVAAATFRPLLIAVAAVTVHFTPVRRLPRSTRRVAATRTRLFVHSLGRRGPPCSAVFA
ncbi:hypothetical protein QFZ24_007083 [Streptomyces phaeochromogenes]|jgi:hypothetical protein|uniref:hypothetical protein n=1 Tax=Streptomyces phaeochromogenes TaxID=1923 RepID=UPI0027943567|nr:hypothetical protein [Streptomyces phaeochromogenes]MDQ0953160.1 hypothetical protein [Streptomyces phaeochromogenes]